MPVFNEVVCSWVMQQQKIIGRVRASVWPGSARFLTFILIVYVAATSQTEQEAENGSRRRFTCLHTKSIWNAYCSHVGNSETEKFTI